ncbi:MULTISPECIES: Uma2 family endonuclease [unclassified Microcoleus]|uniref:Uma2 family endonuclease n=1 Tax=unclassified Microcoleus TaxID=2642155 RepID=UPI001D77BB08|nr:MULTISPECIES: Uma2 family endonuclease [unclassified Microcoleus]TAF89359.1 MAG: Uma2 family endonuclease [Oscillatoriales cyanobacterium]MCC3448149.1 Uma2 family endonuclease [Microcoleus sp. PH2017_09_SFU_O_A]MCC3594797.1 Uma2 family endonuclease [Microcoleus sp. PH2017_28_MFU_U_A]MCC3629088.1 Uma2 family endonuclease [Microcoleus sp. PH2017_39_LGB_O_B]MCC3641182.1 Uma2 family endonuclease [Microcoleus sp. PH2017_33_LGB_O_A]
MAFSSAITQVLETDIWVKATWEEFLAFTEDSAWEKGKFYYDREQMRVEMSPVGPLHARHNSIIPYVVILFAALRNIRVVQFANASFRKTGIREFQPDLAYYIGSDLRVPPNDSNSPVNLNEYDPPNLVIEIGASSFSDDLGNKRLLYEDAGISEYWVERANTREVFAFAINGGGSGRVQQSRVLPGLEIALVEEALNQSQTQDDGEINRWLIQNFSQG